MRRAGIWISILLLSVGLAVAGSPKVARDLQNKKPGERVDVIVQFKDAPTAKQHDKVKSRRGTMKAELGLVKGGAYSLPAEELESLAADPDVAYISPDLEVTPAMDYSRPTIGADFANTSGWDGTGIGVAVIDSGVSTPPDLVKARVYSETFVGSKVDEVYGHGTHVAGIIAGIGKDSSKKYLGVAPGAKIINLRVLGDNGTGTDSAVIAAIQRAIALKSTYNIRVINLSLGRPVQQSYLVDPLCQAVEAAWKAGIVVVVAAGNEGRNNSQGTNGYATISAPGNDPYVITVGAMKSGNTISRVDDYIASYSSKGPTLFDHVAKPDLVAPGNRVVSVSTKGVSYMEKNYPGNMVGAAYFRLSGTSMAAPMVSGAVALMLQKDPSLTPDQVKARLMKTASKAFPTTSTAFDPVTGVPYYSQYDIFTVGAGYLDIAAALANTDKATKPSLSPRAVYDSATGSVRLVQDTAAIWGDSVIWGGSVIWGNAVIWGGSVIWGDAVIWGNAAIWGNTSTSGFSLVWGNAAIWGGSAPMGEATGIAVNGEN